MTFLDVVLVVAQFAAITIIGWTLSGLVVEWLFGREEIGLPERALFAIASFVLFAIALTTIHIVTGGAVFGSPFVVPLVGLAVIVLGARRDGLRVPEVPWRPVVVALSVLLALFVIPMFVAGSSVREGDPPWHMGWTHELLDGQPLPDGPAPEFGRNAYPWGWHGVLATTTRLVPGSSPLLSHETLHVVLVLAIPLAAACLARRVRCDAGWFAAAAAALIAGFGWLGGTVPGFVASPTEARYGADRVAASPNSVYELFPPALPREMGLLLLACGAVLLMFGLRRDDERAWIAAGAIAGCAALVSFPMLIPALLWIALCAFLSPAGRRMARCARAAVPALVLFALWFGPLVFWYVTEGGFVDVVPVLGVEWPLPTALSAWGLLLPLAVVGIVLVMRDRDLEARALLGFAVVSAVLVGLAVARRAFGWGLEGNETLLHQGRMWPVAHLVAAALGGIALNALFRRSKGGRIAAVAIVAVGVISLVMSSAGLVSLIGDRKKGFVYADEDIDEGSFVRAAAEHLSPGDVVEVGDNDALAFKLFEFSGVALANYDDPRLEGNEVRIRYRDLAERYMTQMEAGGFEATHVVVEADVDVAGSVLEEGEYRGRKWKLVDVR